MVAVKAPGFGDRRKAILEDIAVLTGGVALLRARSAITKLKGDNHEQDVGIKIVLRAVEEPLRHVAGLPADKPSAPSDHHGGGFGGRDF